MQEQDYQRVARALEYLQENHLNQPSLDEVAQAVGLSASHFQRVFQRWAGVSPKRFLQYLTLQRAKRLLEASEPVLETALDCGLSGPGRLHDLFVSVEAVTPGEYKRLGRDLEIRYGVQPGPFGEAFLAVTERGVCHLSFLEPLTPERVLAQLRRRWPGALLREDQAAVEAWNRRIFAHGEPRNPLPVYLKGTNFQLKVWEALLAVPVGSVCSYQGLARALGKPQATRAVAGAVASNPISYLIPCHRVIRSTGAVSGYAGGVTRKRALLGWEAARGPEGVEAQSVHGSRVNLASA